jgi:hypothetical protein
MRNFFLRYRWLLLGLLLLLVCAGAFLGTRSKSNLLFRNKNVVEKPGVVAANNVSTPPPSRPSSASSVTNPRRRIKTEASSEDGDTPSISIVSDRPRFVAANSPAQRKSAETDRQLQTVSVSLRDYRKAFNQNPVGNNAEITRVLSGKNSRSIRYLPADAHINGSGELTDRWDQPVFFHQISGTLMEIRSAGPDHIMWTTDDEVLR